MDRTEKRIAISVILLLAVFFIVRQMENASSTEYGDPEYSLPYHINGSFGEDIEQDRYLLETELGAQQMIFRTYLAGQAKITLYLAYYRDVDSANRVHAPTVCYPGQGWTVVGNDDISQKMGEREIKLNRLLIARGSQREVVYNWWLTRERTFTRNSANRLNQIVNIITGGDPTCMWVRLSVEIGEHDRQDQEEHMVQFASRLLPLLDNYFSME